MIPRGKGSTTLTHFLDIPDPTGVLQPSNAFDGRSSRFEAWFASWEEITVYSYITSSVREA